MTLYFAHSVIGRLVRRLLQETKSPKSPANTLVFESLEPRLLLAADPLGITVIEANGSTHFTEVGDHFFLYDGSGSGPSLKYAGADYVAGQFGAWTPIGAEQTATGYEVAWKVTGADQYTVWATDSSGSYTSNNVAGAPVVAGTSSALEMLEPSFHQDLNSDGVIGAPTVIESFGSTSLVEVGTNYFLYPVGGSSGPELSYFGAPVVAGQFGAWTPIGAEQTATGYEVAWKVTGADQYSVWNTDSSGSYTSNNGAGAPVVAGTSSALEMLEPSFHQDLNGDGVIGAPPVIESFGSTSLVEVGTNYFLYPVGGSSGPELSYFGAPVVAGQFGSWTPLGAEQTASGYEVAWKVTGADQYSVWATDSSGSYTSNNGAGAPVVAGTSSALEMLEPSFHQDLNSDGVIGTTAALRVMITAPTDGSTLSGTVTITANVSDNVGVAGVQFYLDGALLGTEDTTAPYSVSWNTTTATNASHTLLARARDAAGNITNSAPLTVTVSNTQSTQIVGVPADRLYDWNPGLNSVGGIPNRTTVFTTVFPGGNIQAAIDAAPPGQVVQLAAGTFTVNNYLLIDKGITLRGTIDPVTHAPLTFLEKTNGATAGSYTATDYNPIIIVGPSRWPLELSTSKNLTSDAVAGTYSVTLASTAGLSPGQFVILDEDDYSSASFIALPNRNGSPTSAEILASDRLVFMDHSPSDPGDDPFPDSLTWFSRMNRPLNELKEIASISGNTVTFTSPITITYTVSKNAQLTSYVNTHVKYAGIENLSVKGGSDGQIRFEAAAYSWMKNVEDTGWLGEGVAIVGSFRIEVRDSYIHDGAWSYPGGGGYAIGLAWASAEVLIENNIILDANKMMVGKSAGAGTVVAYNYTDDGFIGYDPSWQEVGISGSHMVGSHHWLFEGNESFNYDSDNTHGNAIYMTVFRNHLTGDRTDFSNPEGNARAVGLMFGSWWQSIIGNVLGTPGQMAGWTYQSPGLGNQWGNDNIWKIGYDPQHWEQDADPKTISTLIRGGNYDYLTNSVHWENIAPQTLPNSLYLSVKPAFFGSYTWPWVDPTGSTQLYILPAKARYDAGKPFALPPTGMIANNDSGLVASENTALSIPASTLLANDTDPNGLSLSIVGVSNPSNGTVSYNASTQTVSFAPNNNYLGPASFTYTITDGQASASANVSLTVNYPITAQSLFNPSDTPATVTWNDPNSVELGVKFQASTNGTITGIRFYKGPQNTGTHVADLWSATGTLLATATFTNETASGWQQVNLANPVVVTAGTTYVVSYHTSGYYSATSNYFATAHTNGSLTALASGTSGGDGVYAYGTGSIFPTNSFNASNYWVDVVFNGASLQPPVEL